MLMGTRVMVVEDEAMVAMMLEDFLEELGCVVVATASRLDEAMVKAADLTMDVAVLDVNLAGRLSYPVAELLLTRKIPFLFATGYGVAGLPERLSEAPVLAKPFLMGQLAVALDAAKRGHPTD
jgi:CheY-like chemotaxis protein